MRGGRRSPERRALEARCGRDVRHRRRNASRRQDCRAVAASHARPDRGRRPGGRRLERSRRSEPGEHRDRSNGRSRARRRLRELGEEDTRVQLDGRWLDLDGERGSAASRRRAPDMRVRRLDRRDRPPGPSGTTPSSSAFTAVASAAPSGSPSCLSPTVPTPPHPGRLRHAQSPPSTPATRFVTARQTTSPGLPSTSRRRALTPTVSTSSGPAPVAPRESGFCSATPKTARTPGLRPCA